MPEESRSFSTPALLRRLPLPWPQRLQHQVPLLLTLVLVAAMAALYLISNSRLADSVSDTAKARALSVAQAAARAGSAAMENEDAEAAERAMRDLATLPGVLRIDAFRPEGATLMSLVVTPHGKVLSGRDPGDIRPPRPGESQTRQLRLGDVDAMQVWVPVGHAASHGSLAVSFSLEGERDQLERLRFESLLASACVGLVAVLVIYAFMLRALAPLQRLAAFSHELARHTGGQLPPDGSSKEVSDLTASLNHASARLHTQMQAIQSTELRTLAILNAAPDAIVGLDANGCVAVANPAVASVLA